VTAGRGDLERVAQVRLAAQVGEVRAGGRRRQRQGQRLGPLGPPLPRRQRGELGEAVERQHLDLAGQRRLPPVGGGDHDRLGAHLACRLGDRQHPGHRPHRPVERQLADHRQLRQRLPLELPGGDQQGDGDRQVEARAGLAEAGRRQVDDDPSQRELEAAVGERRPHPLARLPDRRVGQADQGEGGQAAVDVDLDPHRPRGDAVERERPRRGEHGGDALRSRPTRGARIGN
jgi:hypothetical protein